MLEFLYRMIFEPTNQESFQAFTQYYGFIYGSWVLILINLGVALCYYYYLGGQGPRFATFNMWLASMLVASFITFLLTGLLVGLGSFNKAAIGDIPGEVWLFSFYNGLMALLLYFGYSWILKGKSVHTRHTPF